MKLPTFLILALVLLAASAWGQVTTGSITAGGADCLTAGRCVSLALNRDAATVGVVISGTWVATNQFEGSANNGGVWTPTNATPMPGGTGVNNTTANGTWRIVVAGLTNLRVRASAYTNGTATVNIQASPAAMAWNIDTPCPVPMGCTGLTGGTSGGILGFPTPTTLASSVALTANALVVGGGAGATPTPLALGAANTVVGMNAAGTANEYKALAVGTTGTDFNIAHAANTVTFHLPDASATARGAVTTGAQTFTGVKTWLGATPFWFDGATAGTFKTVLTITDPTADRTFTLPNADSVAVQPYAGAANNFLTAISTLGVVSYAQPAFTDLSGTISTTQLGTTNTPQFLRVGIGIPAHAVYPAMIHTSTTGGGANMTVVDYAISMVGVGFVNDAASDYVDAVVQGRTLDFFAGAAATPNRSALFIDTTGYAGLGTSARAGSAIPGQKLDVWGGNIEVADPSVLGTESFTAPADFSNVAWTVNSEFTVVGTFARYTYAATGAGNLTQAAPAVAMVANRGYQITYVISAGPTQVGGIMTVTTACAAAVAYLPLGAGSHTINFKSKTTPLPCVIAVASVASGSFTIESASLKEVQGGNVIVDGLVTGGGTTGIRVLSSGAVQLTGPALGTTYGGLGASLAAAGAGTYPKSNGATPAVYAASTLAASGVGTPTACTNQFVTGFTLAGDSAPTSTCTSIVAGDLGTTLTPQFARVGAGQAADATAPFAGTIDSATTNTILDVLKLTRSTTGTAGNGIGGALVLYAEDASGNIEEAGRFQASYPIAAHATQTGRVDITVMGAPGGSLSTAGSTAWGVNAGISNIGGYQTATGSSAGQNNTGANQTATGFSAGYSNTGAYQTATGFNAGRSNSGGDQTATGSYAGYYNTGANQTAMGVRAGASNTGANQTAMGANAGDSNIGANQTAMGANAGYSNTGVNQIATGSYAGDHNTGADQTAMGNSAGYYNTGTYQIVMGANAGNANTGVNQTAMGVRAGDHNTGANQTAMGFYAGAFNNWPDTVRVGYQSSVYFPDDAGSLKNITEANITAANTITYVAHGFGTPGGKVNVRYLLTGGTPPVGLVHNTIYQFTVTSADVLTLSGIAFPAAAFTGTLNNSTDTSNSIAIGVDANPTKANQAVLGPSTITETILRGNVGIGTVAPAEKLHVYNGNSRIDYGHTQFISEATPGAPTSNAVTDGGACTDGSHVIATTFVTANGETQYGAVSAPQTCVLGTTKQTIPVSAIPTGTSGVTTGRNICASKAGTTTPLYQVGASPTIGNNSDTTYPFVTPDTSLTVACNAADTTTGGIWADGVLRARADATGFGFPAGSASAPAINFGPGGSGGSVTGFYYCGGNVLCWTGGGGLRGVYGGNLQISFGLGGTDNLQGGYVTFWNGAGVINGTLGSWGTGQIGFAGTAAKTIGIAPRTTAGTGWDFTTTASRAKSGETDTPGGNNIIASGIGTGNAAGSQFIVQTPTPISGCVGAGCQVDQTLVTRTITDVTGQTINYGHLKFISEVTPGAPTSNAPTAGGSCTAGTHVFVTTFVTANGETQYGAASAAQTCGANATVPLSAIPAGTSGVTTGRNICASKAGTTTPLYQVGASPTIADNSTTTYDFVTADGSLTVACNATDSTAGRIQLDGVARVLPEAEFPVLDGDVTTTAGDLTTAVKTNLRIGSFGISIDGGGSAITTGIKGEIQVPFACTINTWTVLLDQSGSIVLDIWKDTYANYPPDVVDTITASDKPTVAGATKATGNCTGWITTVAAGDTIRYNVDSAATATRATVIIKCTKT